MIPIVEQMRATDMAVGQSTGLPLAWPRRNQITRIKITLLAHMSAEYSQGCLRAHVLIGER
jgi:hypothetical protein